MDDLPACPHDTTPPEKTLPILAVAMFSDPATSLYWPPDVARYDMETLLFSSSGWLRTACIVLALFWYGRRCTTASRSAC